MHKINLEPMNLQCEFREKLPRTWWSSFLLHKHTLPRWTGTQSFKRFFASITPRCGPGLGLEVVFLKSPTCAVKNVELPKRRINCNGITRTFHSQGPPLVLPGPFFGICHLQPIAMSLSTVLYLRGTCSLKRPQSLNCVIWGSCEC